MEGRAEKSITTGPPAYACSPAAKPRVAPWLGAWPWMAHQKALDPGPRLLEGACGRGGGVSVGPFDGGNQTDE